MPKPITRPDTKTKYLVNTVEFVLEEDEATGEYGFIPAKSYRDNKDFNACTTAEFLFHDVFEHWFEDSHKYFLEEYAYDRSGEMVAAACCYYYCYVLGIRNRIIKNKYRKTSYEEDLLYADFEAILSYIYYDDDNYAKNKLKSCIPYQDRIDDNYFEDLIERSYDRFQNELKAKNSGGKVKENPRYEKSVTLKKVRNLFRYGYKMAELYIPNTIHNQERLIEFIDFWNLFFKKINLSYLSDDYESLTFRIYKTRSKIEWTGILKSKYDDHKIPTIRFKSNDNPQNKLHLLDYYE